jgi:hypothetical protein
MKRFLATILSIFYLTLSSSAAISIHYCKGELENININSHSETCCCGEVEISNSCCNVDELILELTIDQQIVSISNIVPENLVLVNDFNFGLDTLQKSEIEESVIENYNLPPPKLEAIWITNCSLTYYG